MKIDFLSLAKQELIQATKYYETRAQGLGYQFQNEVSQSLLRLNEYPESYQKIESHLRRCLINRFPYALIYHHNKTIKQILIVAVSHLNKKPQYWLKRI